MTFFADGDLSDAAVGECGLLGDDKGVRFKTGRDEEVDEEGGGTVMGIDEVTILRVVFHAGAHAAPHALVGLRVDAVALGAQCGEIDVAACRGVLRGEDVIPHRALVEVSVLRIARAVGQHFRKLQHVVGVTAFRSVQMVDVSVAVGHRQEVLAHRVAADADGAVHGHVLPEVLGSLLIVVQRAALLENTLHADEFGHLCVGVLAVEESLVQRLHAVEHGFMGEFLRGIEILCVAEELIGVEHRLVHAAVLAVEEAFEVAVADLRDKVDTPVGQLAEHLLGLLAIAIEIGIA